MADYEFLPEFPQDSPEWHKARESSLGASEVAAVLGLSPWQTPRSVYLSKKGVRNEIPENLSYFGNALEPVIADWVAKYHPEVGVISDKISIRSTLYPWLTATPDRVVKGRPLELKTSSAYSRDKWVDGVPDYYKVQSIVQQGIMGADYGYVAVLHGGNDAELYKVDFDAEVWGQIVEITRNFWENNVLANVEPEPMGAVEIAETRRNTGKEIEVDERFLKAWYLDGIERSALKASEEKIDAVKAALQNVLHTQNADVLTFRGKAIYSWKRNRDKAVFDEERFKNENADLVAQWERTREDPRYQKFVPGSLVFLRRSVKDFEADPPAGLEGRSVVDILDELGV